MAEKGYDFSGYATKYDLLCTDGRTIKKAAFKHMDGAKIPMVWQHGHQDVNNVLGHAILEDRDDGVYAYGYFNDTPGGVAAKKAVVHKDIVALSIFANQLVEKKKLVHSGNIRELSLVLAGANPGAFIENISIEHADGLSIESEEDAVISPMTALEFETEDVVTHADPPKTEEKTVGDVVESMNEEQKQVMYALIAQAMGNSGGEAAQSENEGETFMKKNVFEREDENEGATLTHAQMKEFAQAVFTDAQKNGSFREAFLAHAGTYGINDIGFLFPDAKVLDSEPGFDTRRMGWVPGWLSGTRHTPFSRIKKLWADLTPEAARAKGYITGNEKVEQVFSLLKRTTEPTTVYKKQRLDRDDIIDITDFNVVNWMWREMRFMLDEEIARAALVGDGRSALSDDKIDPTKIRPIYGDDPLYVHYLTLNVGVTDPMDVMDAVLAARINYKGTGNPNFYTTNTVITDFLLTRDTTNRRLYRTLAEVAAELRVNEIIEVEVLNGVQRTVAGGGGFTANLLGIMVNPRDYVYGADKGGQIATFDDFDIDFNQYKYLIETRLSGSLLEPKSALVVERKTA